VNAEAVKIGKEAEEANAIASQVGVRGGQMSLRQRGAKVQADWLGGVRLACGGFAVGVLFMQLPHQQQPMWLVRRLGAALLLAHTRQSA